MGFISQTFNAIKNSYSILLGLDKRLNLIQEALGRIESRQISLTSNCNIQEYEFKIFSQWGDDGIIEYLINKLDIPNKTFVEFGVENYTEANTRFLLINNNWRGLVMDGSSENISYIKSDQIYWQHDLQAIHAFVDVDNVNDLISGAGFPNELGLLHIDIDGNDYWIWQAVRSINPIIVIVEYNSLFGSHNAWTTPYDPRFIRSKFHHNNLCYGSSLTSLCDLAEEKGYYFIGSNSAGNNAYFIRKDKISDLKPLTALEGYVASKFKESRDENGKLTFLRDTQRFDAIRGMRVFDTRLKSLVAIS